MNHNKNRLGGLSNFIGGVGYTGVAFQWIWSSIPLLYPLIKTDVFKTYFMPHEVTTPTEPASLGPTLSSGLELLVVIIAIVFSISVIVYAITMVPRSFGKAGKTVVTKSADVIIPAITRHKNISKKERRTLVSRISWGIKALLVLIPTGLLVITIPGDLQLTQNQFAAAGIILTIASTLLFLAQYTLAKIAKLPGDKTW